MSVLDTLKALEAKATPGLWEVNPVRDNAGAAYPTSYQTWCFIEPSVCGLWANRGTDLNDATLIAALRNNAKALIACAENLQKILDSNSDIQYHGQAAKNARSAADKDCELCDAVIAAREALRQLEEAK